jgi:hypothetical protein
MSIYKHNNKDIMANVLFFSYSQLKFTDMPLFTICIVTCTQRANIKVFDP